MSHSQCHSYSDLCNHREDNEGLRMLVVVACSVDLSSRHTT